MSEAKTYTIKRSEWNAYRASGLSPSNMSLLYNPKYEDGKQLRDFIYVKDITHWIHLTRAQYQLNRSGFHWTEVAYGAADFFPIALLKKWPVLGRWIYKLVGTIVFQGNLRRSVQTSSGFMMIDCHSNSKSDLVNTGRRAYRCLLKLSEWGYYSQPMTLYSIYSWMQGKWTINSPFNENQKTLKSLHEKYIDAFGIQNPFWLFRFGVFSKKITPSLRKLT